ncbi:two-component system sensor histidine kinase NtrB [Salipaludibacillus sp. HK11]|uniref:two-component system sensor histidine kinase NtrB n=1 Tax=Salipaludibacillus sp. HK11 TaxID=3394320 RepID=UPI0039FC679B
MKLFKKWSTQKKSLEEKEDDTPQKKTVKFEGSAISRDDYHRAIGKMSAFFAHEIRNPLTSVIGFTQVLERDETINADPKLKNYISIIKDESTKMESLIQELLNLSNSHTYFENLSIINVRKSIEKVITLYDYPSSLKQIEISKNIPNDVFVSGNESGFERMLINMIKNAMESIGENGTIQIDAHKVKDFIHIDIIDSGPGIADEDLENIFYPFYTTKDEGTGIGLPICKTIIETMQGTIDIRNHSQLGVHIIIKIPASKHALYKR